MVFALLTERVCRSNRDNVPPANRQAGKHYVAFACLVRLVLACAYCNGRMYGFAILSLIPIIFCLYVCSKLTYAS